MSARFMNTLGFTIKRTQLRLARELVLSLYPKALAEWGPLIARFDELDDRADVASTLPSAEQADEDLAAWLEDVRLDDEGEANGNGNRNRNGASDEETHARRCTHPKISMNSVALYRCAWCGNPSAMLRKCGGCGQTKYVAGLERLLRLRGAHLYFFTGIATANARRSIGPSTSTLARSNCRPTSRKKYSEAVSSCWIVYSYPSSHFM